MPRPLASENSKVASTSERHHSPEHRLTLEQVEQLVAAHNRSSVPDEFIVAQAFQESGFQPMVFHNPKKKGSARGLLQVEPTALAEVKSKSDYARYQGYTIEDMLDPGKNIEIATAYLQFKLDEKHGDLSAALQSYGTGLYDAVTAGATALQRNPSDFAGMTTAMTKAEHQ